MNANVAMKYGRRRAGTWGNPSRHLKTVAARAIRRLRLKELRDSLRG